MISASEIQHIRQPYIIHNTNYTLEHSHVIGTLSVKCVFNGQATYTIEGADITIDDSRYMVLNHAQPYNMHIDSKQPVETFCIFLPQSWLIDVYRNMTQSDNQLLVNPYDTTQPLLLIEAPVWHDDIVSPLVFNLRQHHHLEQLAQIEIVSQEIIRRLIIRQLSSIVSPESLDSMRPSTRIELYRRMKLIQEHILSNLHRALTIDNLARVACMSRYHFLRRFTEVHHMTPHQYIITQRLNRAQNLLSSTNLSVTEICMLVGFQSLGSFSTRFRRAYGISPRMYRNTIKVK